MAIGFVRSRSAVFDAALDAIITIDARGRIVEFNAAAERTFGSSRDLACGQLLVDLIIPPRFRLAHREGLRRYMQTGEAHVLGRRIQLAALRPTAPSFRSSSASSVCRTSIGRSSPAFSAT